MEPDQETLGDRARTRGWTAVNAGTWALSSPDGTVQATVRALPHGYEARVAHDEAHPAEADPSNLARGPELFESCDDALDYAESKLQAGDARPPRRST